MISRFESGILGKDLYSINVLYTEMLIIMSTDKVILGLNKKASYSSNKRLFTLLCRDCHKGNVIHPSQTL